MKNLQISIILLLIIIFNLVNSKPLVKASELKLLSCSLSECNNLETYISADNLEINFADERSFKLVFYHNFSDTEQENQDYRIELWDSSLEQPKLVSVSFLDTDLKNKSPNLKSSAEIIAFNGTKNFILKVYDQNLTNIASYDLQITGTASNNDLVLGDYDCSEDAFDKCDFANYLFNNLRIKGNHSVKREISVSKQKDGLIQLDIPTPATNINNDFSILEQEVVEANNFEDILSYTSDGRLALGEQEPRALVDIRSTNGDRAAIVFEKSKLTEKPVNGALEYDGNSLYFTSNNKRKKLEFDLSDDRVGEYESRNIVDQSIMINDLNPEIASYMSNLALEFSAIIGNGSITPLKFAGVNTPVGENKYYGTNNAGEVGFHDVGSVIFKQNIDDNTVIDFSKLTAIYDAEYTGAQTLSFNNVNVGHKVILNITSYDDLNLPASTQVGQDYLYDKFRQHHVLVFDVFDDTNSKEIVDTKIFNWGDIKEDIYYEFSDIVAVYSLTKTRSDYNGSAVEVERSNGGTIDIGFDANGELDLNTLNLFCAGAITCSVRTWYDQSTNGNNAVQTDVTKQPLISVNGTVFTSSTGKPTIVSNNDDGANSFGGGTEMFLQFNIQAFNNSEYSVFMATERRDAGGNQYPISNTGDLQNDEIFYLGWVTNTGLQAGQINNEIDLAVPAYVSPQMQLISTFSLNANAGRSLYLDSVLAGTTANATKLTIHPGDFGQIFTSIDSSGVYEYRGAISEVVIYSADHANYRKVIEEQIKRNVGL
jgi:hypothetical protein